MKKILLAFGLWVVSVPAFAAIEVSEYPIVGFGTPQAVSVSTSAYTNVTSTNVRISNLAAILIDNPSTNSAAVHGHIGNCTSTAVSISAVTGPIEIHPGAGGGYILLAADACLWLVSRHTSAESIMLQGTHQRR